SGFARAGAPVAVLEADDVVQLGGRHLEDVAVLDPGHAVDGAGRDVEGVARLHLEPAQLRGLAPASRLEEHPAGLDQDRLVRQVVVLERQALAPAQVEDLAHVAFGAGPPELVAPGFLDAARDLGHGKAILPETPDGRPARRRAPPGAAPRSPPPSAAPGR